MTSPPESNTPETSKQSDLDSYSIEEFCRRNSISKSTYYLMQSEGTGPVEGHAKNRVLISKESALEWRQNIAKKARPMEGEDGNLPSKQRAKQNRRP